MTPTTAPQTRSGPDAQARIGAENFKHRIGNSSALDAYRAPAGQTPSRLTANASSRLNDSEHLGIIRSGNIDDAPLTARALLIHCADVLDTVVGVIASGIPVGQCGRGVIAHVADRLRAVAEVLK